MYLGYINLLWQDVLFNSCNSLPGLLSVYIFLFFSFFFTGCIGLFWRADSLLLALIFGELLLVSIVFGFVIISKFWAIRSGQVYALSVLNAAAVESAIGLVLLLNSYRTNGSVHFNALQSLRG